MRLYEHMAHKKGQNICCIVVVFLLFLSKSHFQGETNKHKIHQPDSKKHNDIQNLHREDGTTGQ